MENIRQKVKSRKIVGISWKKVYNVENEVVGGTAYKMFEGDSPVPGGGAEPKHGGECGSWRPLQENQWNEQREKSTRKQPFQRSYSVRGMVGSIRQKLRMSTRRRKQLFEVNGSPAAPSPCPYSPITPAKRRSERIARREEVIMSSPFGVETPQSMPRVRRTPLREGLNDPRRFNFSSPGTFQRDLSDVSEGMKRLTEIAQEWERDQDVSNTIRTSPFQRSRNTVVRRKRASIRPSHREPPKETML